MRKLPFRSGEEFLEWVIDHALWDLLDFVKKYLAGFVVICLTSLCVAIWAVVKHLPWWLLILAVCSLLVCFVAIVLEILEGRWSWRKRKPVSPSAVTPEALRKSVVNDVFHGADLSKYIGVPVDGPIKFQRVDEMPRHGQPDKMQVILDVDRPEDEPKRVYPWAFSCIVPDDKEHEVFHRLMPGTPVRITGIVEGLSMGIRIANPKLFLP